MTAAARNPHAIMFTSQQRAAYEQLRDLFMTSAVAPSVQVPSTVPGSSDTVGSRRSVADELAKLHALYQQGVLTPAEFEQAKARPLRRVCAGYRPRACTPVRLGPGRLLYFRAVPNGVRA